MEINIQINQIENTDVGYFEGLLKRIRRSDRDLMIGVVFACWLVLRLHSGREKFIGVYYELRVRRSTFLLPCFCRAAGKVGFGSRFGLDRGVRFFTAFGEMYMGVEYNDAH